MGLGEDRSLDGGEMGIMGGRSRDAWEAGGGGRKSWDRNADEMGKSTDTLCEG